jgi:hypothetical protein
MQAIVASGRPNAPSPGTVTIVPPPGWKASPAGRLFTLAPGGHFVLDTTLTAAPDARRGRYFVAARIEDGSGQVHEDVVTVDYDPELDGRDRQADGDVTAERPALGEAIVRAMRDGGPGREAARAAARSFEPEPGSELAVAMLTRSVVLAAGERDVISVGLRNLTSSEIRGEAQLVSPHETWSSITPWTQGFVVGPGDETTAGFAVEPPADHHGGTYWALVKVMFFGRIHYSETIPIRIAAVVDRQPTGAATASAQAGS